MYRDKSTRDVVPPAPAWVARLVALLLLAPTAILAAPDMVLKDPSGKSRNVNEFIGRGQWVIVTVWSADCPICRRDMYHMTFFQEEHKEKGIQVLGLSIDGYAQRDQAQDFIDEQSLNFPNLIGTPADASRLSGHRFRGTPTYYFFAPDGAFMAVHVGSLTGAQAERVLRALKKDRPR